MTHIDNERRPVSSPRSIYRLQLIALEQVFGSVELIKNQFRLSLLAWLAEAMTRCSGGAAALALLSALLCTFCTATLDLAAVLKSANGDAEWMQQARW